MKQLALLITKLECFPHETQTWTNYISEDLSKDHENLLQLDQDDGCILLNKRQGLGAVLFLQLLTLQSSSNLVLKVKTDKYHHLQGIDQQHPFDSNKMHHIAFQIPYEHSDSCD